MIDTLISQALSRAFFLFNWSLCVYITLKSKNAFGAVFFRFEWVFLCIGFLTVLRASSNQYLVWFLAVLLLQ